MNYLIFSILYLIIPSSVFAAFDFTIIHTNDLHSYVGGMGPDALYSPSIEDKDPVYGHYARLSFLINKTKQKLKEKNEPYLLIDAGDFYGGTVFQVLGPNKEIPVVPELEFFLYNDYDFTTIGNHEFDNKDIGFYHMLNKIDKNKGKFKILSTNLTFNNPNSKWKKFFQPYQGIKHQSLLTDIYIKELKDDKQTLKLGFIGMLGPDGAKVSISNRSDASFVGMDDKAVKVEFDKLYALLQKTVDQLKKKYQVDIVVVTMHAGTPEDNHIAENVDGIDVIIAGHTHELYEVPRHINETIITQVKCYGNYLGILPLSWDGKKLKLQNNDPTYRLIDNSIASDPVYLKKVEQYKKHINNALTKYDYTYDTAIFKANASAKRVNGQSHNNVGVMVSSAIKKQYNLSKSDKDASIDLFFTSLGLVRSDIVSPQKQTPYQFSDTFKFLPLGSSNDGEPGFPIVHFYLPKDEVRLLINFMEIYKHFSDNFTPVFSNDLTYKVNKWGIPMWNRIKDLKLRGLPFDKWPNHIHLATTSYVSSYINKVGPMSYGLVSFNPVDKKGHPIKKAIITNKKEFKLFSDYMKTIGEYPHPSITYP